jgi:hypothetical protein
MKASERPPKILSTLHLIISGGQTCVDRAALDAAIQYNLPHSGWCPLGRKAEDGIIDQRYNLHETNTDNYDERTRQNIDDSDGTLILVANLSIDISPGTMLTHDYLKQVKKPHLLINLSQETSIATLINWVKINNIHILNIAGPRESQVPGIYLLTRKFLSQLFKQ